MNHSNLDLFIMAGFCAAILGVASTKPDFYWDGGCTGITVAMFVLIALGMFLPTKPRRPIPRRFRR